MRRRVRLIFTPHAHRGRAWCQASSLQAILAACGDPEWAATEHPGPATPPAEEAARQGFDIVAALGGDGTANEVINGLMRVPADRRPLMAVVPLGPGTTLPPTSA
jgi:diacylglycerol kinase family enzyme